MQRWAKLARERGKPRDSFFFLVGCGIVYHEVWIATEAQPLLIFTALFLWGLIPAFWGDRAKPEAPPPPSPPDPPQFEPAPDEKARSRLTPCVALA